MITDCMPFAICFSIVISAIVTLFFSLTQEWIHEYDFPIKMQWVIAIVVIVIVTVATSLQEVKVEQVGIRVAIKNTSKETIAFSLSDKKMICAFPRQKDTNSIRVITQQNYLNFWGSAIKIDYVYKK